MTQKRERMDMQIVINDHMDDSMNIGGLLRKWISENEVEHFNRVLLRVANGNFWGTYSVPTAIGFSTPLTLCKGGVLMLDKLSDGMDVLTLLEEWSLCFGCYGCRKDNTFTYTSTHQGCAICTSEYKVGDTLITMNACGHVYHLSCQKKWAYVGKDDLQFALASADCSRITSRCPVCNKITS